MGLIAINYKKVKEFAHKEFMQKWAKQRFKTKNLNFEECFVLMEQEHFMRRSCWNKGDYIYHDGIKIRSNDGFTSALNTRDTKANDWEIYNNVEEENVD
jgi:hypothetical protein